MGQTHPHQKGSEASNQSRQSQPFYSKQKRFDSTNQDPEKPLDTNKNLCANDDQKGSEDLEMTPLDAESYSNKTERIGKLLIFLMIITCLLLGKNLTFSSKILCVGDKVLDLLQFANEFINTPGKEMYRDFFQGLCSFSVDLTFLATFGYWAIFGSNARLPISLGLFYAVRALIQTIWYSPFPEGFYWNSPGFPSLVVPYGRGSDFFFSGHSGFLLICLEEWHRIGKTRMRNIVFIPLVYTILILLVYRIHYSIDVLVGLVFSDMCFWWVDQHVNKIDSTAAVIASGLKWIWGKLSFCEDKKKIEDDHQELVV